MPRRGSGGPPAGNFFANISSEKGIFGQFKGPRKIKAKKVHRKSS